MEALSSVTDYLKGLKFPAKKEEIVKYAHDRNAPDAVTNVLEKIPDQIYDSAEAVIKKVSGGFAGVFGKR